MLVAVYDPSVDVSGVLVCDVLGGGSVSEGLNVVYVIMRSGV